MEDNFDFWSLANTNTNNSSGPQDDQAQPQNYTSYPQDPSLDHLLDGLDASSVNNLLEYGVPLPVPAQTQPGYASGSHSVHYPDPVPFQQYTPNAMMPLSQASPYTSDAQLQLEILRETRRIRELELTIATEKRRSDEAIMRQREAEATLATVNHAPSHNTFESFNSVSNPDPFEASDPWPFALFPSMPEYDADPSAMSGSSPSDVSMDVTPDLPPVMSFSTLR